jgi:hypothetical protein
MTALSLKQEKRTTCYYVDLTSLETQQTKDIKLNCRTFHLIH